ncbi:MAG: EAL domain-containing protein [Cyanobacteria bacterium J06598_3]
MTHCFRFHRCRERNRAPIPEILSFNTLKVMDAALNVLLVKSSLQDIQLIESVVAAADQMSVDIQRATTLEDSLLSLSQQSFDLVLLGQGIPDNAETRFAIRMLEAATSARILSLPARDEGAVDGSGGNDPSSLVTVLNSAMASRTSITHLAKAIQQLQLREERYVLAAEGCRDGIWDWDIKQNSVFYSEHWLAMLGLSGQSLSNTLDDWLDRVHPEDIADLKRSLDDHLCRRCADFRCEYRIRQANGDYLWVLSRGCALWDSAGNAYRMAGSQIDINDHKQLAWQASHDNLTNLANRKQFLTLLEQLSLAQPSATHVVCYLDLDHFKVVNDTCGHAAGDELLRQISAMLTSNIRRSDLLARLGGDEFGLIICDCSLDQALGIAHDLIDLVKKFRFCWKGKVFSIGVSIGVVPVPAARIAADELLTLADSACYAAKNKGRNQVQVYSKDNAGVIKLCADQHWVTSLTQALEEDLFCLYYQEVRPLKPGSPVIWEVLLRLPCEVTDALTMPMAFIPPAQRYDLMAQLDRWMVRQCFAQIQKAGRSEIIYSLNLSGDTLSDGSFIGFLERAIADFKIMPNRLCFEVSESTVMANFSQVAAMVKRLKKLGFRFALDNFGSGLSSLVYLNQLPIDYLKLDGGLIAKINHDKVAYATLQSINNIGHIMGLETIAGCVSNSALLNTIEGLTMDYAQGFEISKPCLLPGSACLAVCAQSVVQPHAVVAS